MWRKRRTELWRNCGDVRDRHAEHYNEESILALAGMYPGGTACMHVKRTCASTFFTKAYPEQDDVLLLVRCRRAKRHACAFRFCAFPRGGGIVGVIILPTLLGWSCEREGEGK